MEKREMICIGCPLGCPLTVTIEKKNGAAAEEAITVTGNTCKNGEIYAKNEVLHPERIVTSTVPVEGGLLPRVSVKTERAIPKDRIFACMEEIHRAAAQAPVRIGDVIVNDVAETGVNVIATSSSAAE